MSSARPRLIVLRALKLGDYLTAIPALRALARAFPDHERILAAPARFAELIGQSGMHRVAPTPDLAALAPDLAGAEVAVDLHGRGPESQRVLLDAAPGRLISFGCRSVPETAGSPQWRPDEHEVHRWCRLLDESGIPADPADLRLHLPPRTPGPGVVRPTIIHPGAASPARRWPAGRFAAVARAEAGSGRTVLVTGGPDELGLAREVAGTAGLAPGSVLAGRTSLAQLTDLVAGAGRVVCGDTGVAHLATATATPSVVLFGPIPPSEWGPPPDPRHVAIWTGRRGDPHAQVVDPGLLAIGVDAVLAALGGLPDPDAPTTERRAVPVG